MSIPICTHVYRASLRFQCAWIPRRPIVFYRFGAVHRETRQGDPGARMVRDLRISERKQLADRPPVIKCQFVGVVK